MRKTLPRFTARWLIPIRGRRIPRRVCICAHPKRRLHNAKCRNCHGYMYHRPNDEAVVLSYRSIDFAAPLWYAHDSAAPAPMPEHFTASWDGGHYSPGLT